MSKIDEIRKRHKDRRNRILGSSGRTSSQYDQPFNPTKNTNGNGVPNQPPLFRSQTFIIKCLIAAGLVLVTGIFFKTYAQAYPEVEKVIRYAMTEDVNFAKVSDWYEKKFGEPLALFPSSKNQSTEKVSGDVKENFAVPVNGTVTKGFSDTKQGVLIQTDVDAKVDAIESGFVVSVGKKDGIGTTVVIRHSDGAESWYGNLATVNVKPYDFVKKEQNIGTVTTAAGKKTGSFYFALKEGDHFVDPIQVIQFD